MIAVVGLAVHTAFDVFRREAFAGGSIGTLEFVTNYYMIAAVFMGLMVAQRHHEHIEVSVLIDRLPQRSKEVVGLAGQAVTLGFVIVLAYYGYHEAVANMHQGERSGVVQVPIWPSRFLVPIGFMAYAIRLGVEIVAELRTFRPRSGEEVKSEGR